MMFAGITTLASSETQEQHDQSLLAVDPVSLNFLKHLLRLLQYQTALQAIVKFF
jgi:hypothetical protein